LYGHKKCYDENLRKPFKKIADKEQKGAMAEAYFGIREGMGLFVAT